MTTLIITGLHRDISKKRSFASFVWKDDPEKRLGVPVPYDCAPEQLQVETEKAVKALAKELESATVESA